jgi:hypothetical protein
MLTDQDIERLKSVFATKDEIKNELDGIVARTVEIMVTKQDLEELKSQVANLKDSNNKILTGIDGIIGILENAEIAATKRQVATHENWHHQIADHLNIKLAD